MKRINGLEFGEETGSEARALVQVLITANQFFDIGKSWEEDFLQQIVIVLTTHPVSLNIRTLPNTFCTRSNLIVASKILGQNRA